MPVAALSVMWFWLDVGSRDISCGGSYGCCCSCCSFWCWGTDVVSFFCTRSPRIPWNLLDLSGQVKPINAHSINLAEQDVKHAECPSMICRRFRCHLGHPSSMMGAFAAPNGVCLVEPRNQLKDAQRQFKEPREIADVQEVDLLLQCHAPRPTKNKLKSYVKQKQQLLKKRRGLCQKVLARPYGGKCLVLECKRM